MTLRLDQATYIFFRILCLYMYLSQHFGKQQINKVNSYAKKINKSLAFYEIINLLRHYKLQNKNETSKYQESFIFP